MKTKCDKTLCYHLSTSINFPFFRYLLHLMLEAGCLEWALIIAVVLRDIMAVDRTVNTASLTETPMEIVGRMREGLSYIELWADTEWCVRGLCYC